MSMEKIPLRRRIGYQEMKSKKGIVRVIKTAEDGIMLDATSRKNDRGAYLCPSMKYLRKAAKRKGLEHSFRVTIPEEVHKILRKEMEEFNR